MGDLKPPEVTRPNHRLLLTQLAGYVVHVPILGPRLTDRCRRCGRPELRGRSEKMPVAFTDVEKGIASETVQFCAECSLEMPLAERLDRLRAIADRERAAASETEDHP